MVLKFSSSYNPWIYFFLFLTVDGYLSYIPSSNFEKYSVFLVGILVPILMILILKSDTPKSEQNIFKQEQFNKSSLGIWILFGLLLMGLRFWRLTTLFQWPTGDEASVGMLAIGLIRQWNWQFFHGFAQIPFLWHWCCALTYQITHSSRLAIWLIPALISALLIPLSYFGAKTFFGNSFSVLFSGLTAVSFWPMFLGRLGFPIFLILWELMVVYGLLIFLKQRDQKLAIKTAGWLGIFMGFGSLTFPSWVVVVTVVVLTVIWVSLRRKFFLPLTFFLGSTILSLVPFLIAAYFEGYGHHIQAVGFWNGFDFKNQAICFANYWMLLWGTVNQQVPYASLWGGFLNPILAALFFLGLLEIYFQFSRNYLILCLSVLFFFMSAGFLSWSLDTWRILQVLPLLLFLSAMGFRCLLNSFSPNTAVLVALLILSSSFALDFYRLTVPYLHPDDHPEVFEGRGRSYEKYYAERILESRYKFDGPGLIYSDFIPNTADESLAFITYPYNCAWNPSLSGEKPRWAAIFINNHFQPFLSRKFPTATWEVIPTADGVNDGTHILGIISVTPQNGLIFKSWQTTYRFCMDMNLRFLDKPNGESGEDILRSMIQFYDQVPADSFLQSVYLEKFMDVYERQKNLYKGTTEFNYYSYRDFLNSSLKKAYPDGLIFAYAGRLLMQEGQLDNARSVLKKAIRIDPDNTLALGLFRVLRSVR